MPKEKRVTQVDLKLQDVKQKIIEREVAHITHKYFNNIKGQAEKKPSSKAFLEYFHNKASRFSET